MFTTKNNYSGAAFDYEGNGCNASGDFRFKEKELENANISGSLEKDGETYAFTANYDNRGAVNIYGVTEVTVLTAIAAEVAVIINGIKSTKEVE